MRDRENIERIANVRLEEEENGRRSKLNPLTILFIY